MKATKTVYCYYFPEIRKLVDNIVSDYPHHVFLKSIEPGLDDFHVPVIQKFVKYRSEDLPALEEYENYYFTNGASEGIFHLLVQAKKEGEIIYVFKGEYEGYKAYGENIGLEVREVDIDEDPTKLEPGTWFISNPSARDGNILDNKIVNNICDAGHKVVLDCTYVGLTKPHKFDVSHENIIAVLFSLSKPCGVYYYRLGFAFTRKPVSTLMPNKWFKNIFSIILADKIISTFEPSYFYTQYKHLQEKIIRKLNKENSLDLKASDVILLAHKNFEKGDPEFYKRGEFLRLCLTPYFLEEEKEHPQT